MSDTLGLRILAALNIAPRSADGEGRYRAPGLSSSSGTGTALSIRIEAGGNFGMFNDFGDSGKKGNLAQLAAELNIELGDNKRAPRARSLLETYASEHGVEAEAFMRAGWKESSFRAKAGDISIKALAFPTKTGERKRVFGPKGTKGAQKYSSPTGYKRSWYRLSEALALAESTGRALVYCNGEASVVSAQWRGIPAVSVAGGGEKEIPTGKSGQLNLLEELVQETGVHDRDTPLEILIALDCDDTGRKHAPLIQAQLARVGFTARAVDLGLADGQDLADFLAYETDVDRLYTLPTLKATSSDTTSDTVEHVIEPEELLAGINNTEDLARRADSGELKLQAPEPIVDASDGHALIRRGRVYLVAGDFKLGKSTFVLHIAHCVSIGAQAVLGVRELSVPRAGRVLMLDLEQELGDTVPRARAMGALSSTLDVLDADAWDAMREKHEHFEADELARMVITSWANKHGESASLVIVDNLSVIEPDMSIKDRGLQERAWMTRYKMLAKSLGVAVLLVEHNNKANAADTSYTSFSRARGSAQKQAATNGGSFLLEFTQEREKDKGDIRLSILPRSGIARKLYLKRDSSLGHHVLSVALEGSNVDESKLTKESQRQILTAIELGTHKSADLIKKTGFARGTVFRVLNELVELKAIRQIERDTYVLSNATIKQGQAFGASMSEEQLGQVRETLALYPAPK
jgi:KaiC/GvpD/RAD55 family RecA-like ATPase